jgi:hypothetical protein
MCEKQECRTVSCICTYFWPTVTIMGFSCRCGEHLLASSICNNYKFRSPTVTPTQPICLTSSLITNRRNSTQTADGTVLDLKCSFHGNNYRLISCTLVGPGFLCLLWHPSNVCLMDQFLCLFRKGKNVIITV